MVDLAESLGLSLPQTVANLGMLVELQSAGHGSDNITAVATWLRGEVGQTRVTV